MAPDPAAPEVAPAEPRRHQWQLPAFVAGIAAAVAAWAYFPPQPSDPAVAFRGQLAKLRKQLEQKPPEVIALDDLVRRIVPAVDKHPADAAVAHYLIGSARLIAAEYGTPVAAAENWADANRHFTACDPTKLADKADAPRFAFRAAKAAAAVGVGDPKLLAPVLAAPPPDEDIGEARRLLADALLRVNPPDLKRAREELVGYLGSKHRAPPAAVARYKLKLADLSLGLGEPEKARQWLKEIGPSAPPEVLAVAKVQEARLAAADNKPAEAVRLFGEAQKIPGLPADQQALVLFELARALQTLNNVSEARKYYQQARSANGPAGVAATVRLAALAARAPEPGPNPLHPADLLEGVVKQVKSAGDFQNPHVGVEELRATFEEVIQAGLKQGDYAGTVRAAAAYTLVAPPGRARLRQAEAAEAWGAKLAAANDPAATEKYRAAATEFEAAAVEQTDPTQKADLLRKAGDCYTRGGDTAAARDLYDRWAMAGGTTPAQAAPALLAKADLLLTEGKYDEAVGVLNRVVADGGPDVLKAKAKLGRAHLNEATRQMRADTSAAARKEAEARASIGRALLGELATHIGDGPGEREVRQQALFDLGRHQLFRDLPDAESRLRQLMQTNPTGRLADGGRLYLGTALLMKARGDTDGGRPPADADRILTEAVAVFELLSRSDDAFYRTHGDLRLVNATLQLRKFGDLPALCDTMATRYRNRPEELVVLSMLYSGYLKAGSRELAARVLARMTDAYARVPAAAYTGGMEELTQAYWKDWFEKVNRR